jgi:SAM-dependent methyltransferase
MDWHRRYVQQARWTRTLRAYIFEQAHLGESSQVLEVGCGTGAILSDIPIPVSLHGLDRDSDALAQCRIHASSACLVQGDALQLPYADQSCDFVYCHYLLLWVRDPLQALVEMRRVAKPGALVAAFAEPDYRARVDEPAELVPLGEWQTESLIRQGADAGLGRRLANLFDQAGIKVRETGPLQTMESDPSPEEWEMEWAVIEADLTGFVSREDLQRMKALDQQARARGERVMHVPTYFAWGQA